MGEGNPADCAQPGLKLMLQRRQCQLDNTGIELAVERGDASRSDDEPGIVAPARDKFRGRRLPAAAKDGC